MSPGAWPRLWGALGGLAGAFGVGLGAYATHGLAGTATDMADIASRYAIYHALALGLVAVLERRPRLWLHLAGGLFGLGTLIFSGSLTALAVLGLAHAPLAPVGGTMLILGWLCLAAAAVTDRGPG